VQHTHDDLGGRTLRFVLVVELDAGGNSSSVVGDRNRVVGMDGDYDIVAMTSQRLVDGVIDDFKHHVMQAGAIRGITNIHSRTFANCFQTLKLLNA